MRKIYWPALALFAALAAGLRVWQCRVGFEPETGLAVRSLPGILLPAALLAAALFFIVAARRLPAKREDVAGSFSAHFRFAGHTGAVVSAVAGAFLVLLGGALSALDGAGTAAVLTLAALTVAAALCLLYTVFALYRGSAVSGAALLVPVCALVAHLVLLYRADASDPVLARIYVGILAVSALTLSALERAAFAFRNGAPRVWLPAGAMSVVLTSAALFPFGDLSTVALLAGCILVEIAFLAAATFE